jgi:RNA polymerase sigma-70 factor, ECF subfamily
MYGAALQRLARAYERDTDRRRDLLQEVHLALWRSFVSFDGRCSLRTWVYRVAHNVATSQVSRRRRRAPTLVGLDELESKPDAIDHEQVLHDRLALDRMMTLIHRLVPLGRQVILLTDPLNDGDLQALWQSRALDQNAISLEFHCVELVRQRDLLRSVWLWALLPIVSGMLALQIGQALAHPEWLSRIVLYCVVMVAGAAGLHALYRRAAARVQERIDRLKEKT